METKDDIGASLSESKGIFPDGFVSEILTLLDQIEIEEDASLAGQRFAICKKHGLTVEFHEQT